MSASGSAISGALLGAGVAGSSASARVLASYSGRFCMKCKTLCHMYEQGLTCDCGQPWEVERIDERDYPPEWIECFVTVTVKP